MISANQRTQGNKGRKGISLESFQVDRSETVPACAKFAISSPLSSLQQIPEFDNVGYSSFGLKLLICQIKKLMYSTFPYLILFDDVILHSFCQSSGMEVDSNFSFDD